ncbi:hypothetical protein LCGC14_0223220 [marine sediment metagenome]|uniref:Uncharacterized protein n=1 Tax=marine sediment metagenome TaxID=412755 RepID=A0A0F9UGC8_9ZZZZ
MSEEKEILDFGDKCKIEFGKNGNIKIGEHCSGKEINNLDIAVLNKFNRLTDEERENEV